jgi:CBS domain containing-hemolysin-like protein
MWSDWAFFGVGLLLTVGTGFFVAAEFALVNLDRHDLEAQRDQGVPGLSLTIRALSITSTHLSSAQLGITLTTLVTGFVMEPALSSLVGPVLEGWGLPATAARVTSGIAAVALATILSMIVGELVPKNFALAIPQRTAQIVMPFQTGFTAVFRPVVVALNASANGVLRALRIEPREELSGARSPEELASLVRRSASEGVLEKDTATLLGRTLAFSELVAGDVMTPRLRLATLEPTDTARDVLDLARTSGYSRFPVTGDGLDDVVGVVHVKSAIAVGRLDRSTVLVRDLMRAPLRVPETMALDALLVELRGQGLQLAIVMDEYGGTAGIATLEDLVEELVGDVADEHDRTRAGVVASGTGDIAFPASLRPDELLEKTGLVVPESDAYETIAGFVMSELGRLAQINDEVLCDAGTLTVVRMDGRRIDRLRFTPAPPSDEGGDDQ